jgi:hypothetical protein
LAIRVLLTLLTPWWHVVNVKSKILGISKHNQCSSPITSQNNVQVHKKFKIYSSQCMSSSTHGEFEIRNLSELLCHQENDHICSHTSDDIFQSNISKLFAMLNANNLELLVSEGTELALTYIAGFVSYFS